ncbi:hypothetical protein GCM10025868_25720 [Angustibacter aerolatus]|uniref:Peptidase M43 pregnancy-associated plasma-A domain-containing protein n=1 Tax=Angustibacter aerolatus TaxID=1162965 RepID=A0ABQ6JHU8_9ACTN|nr:hypothetical protein GCM10025868_25720 [Angustibacter aerolatus]
MPRAADGSTVGPSTPAHELMHNLGAVQASAPHSTTEGHCTDEYDVMCYVDGGLNPRTGNTATTTTVCKGTAANPRADDALFDCRHDDYFNLFPGSNSTSRATGTPPTRGTSTSCRAGWCSPGPAAASAARARCAAAGP